jgi:hypothetical protein
MAIQDIKFTGLIRDRKLSEITGPEFFNALRACGWQEGTGTHFFQQLRKDGPPRGIHTPGDLSRAIATGFSTPGRDGKAIHRICNRSAYIVYNAATQTLVTFSQGDPPDSVAKWDVDKAIAHLRANARPPYGIRKCAKFVREAIEAGGLRIPMVGSDLAKDYGLRLKLAGFLAQAATGPPYQKGDVAVIDGFTSAAEGIKNAHLEGHMAMYDGTQWISDYKQPGTRPYAGSAFDKAKPRFVIYRYPK